MKNVFLVSVVCLWHAAAQSRSAFEVASVKSANTQGRALRVTGRVDADGINFTNMMLRVCIQRAFGIKPYQLIAPDWIDTERYSIVAKAAGPTPQEKLMEMLQTLLVERFKLAFHREAKEMPVYALVVAKNGPRLTEATDEGVTDVGGGDGEELVFERVPMDILAQVLARSVDRPVLNQTELKGRYNFKLAWAEQGRMRPAGAGPAEASDPADAASIFTALQERLGLKLESRRAPVEILVVDRVEKPTEN